MDSILRPVVRRSKILFNERLELQEPPGSCDRHHGFSFGLGLRRRSNPRSVSHCNTSNNTVPGTVSYSRAPTTPSQAQSSTPEWQPPPELPGLALERVFGNPTFSRLTNLVQTGGRLFVTEQTGRVMAFPISQVVSEATVFLDIQDRVNDAGN